MLWVTDSASDAGESTPAWLNVRVYCSAATPRCNGVPTSFTPAKVARPPTIVAVVAPSLRSPPLPEAIETVTKPSALSAR